MPNNIKIERLQSIISRDITIILLRECKNPILQSLSIHEVKLSKDLSHAKIYYSSLLNEPVENLQKVIEQNKKDIRAKLAAKLDIYKCPELDFLYDHSLENANKINDILQQTKK